MTNIDQRLEQTLDNLTQSIFKMTKEAIGTYEKGVADHKRQNKEARLKTESQQKRFEELKAEYNQRFG